jgi:hypothetical protein
MRMKNLTLARQNGLCLILLFQADAHAKNNQFVSYDNDDVDTLPSVSKATTKKEVNKKKIIFH